MKTTTIIVILLFIFASVFLVMFALELRSGSDKSIVSGTSSTVISSESTLSNQTSSTEYTETTVIENTSTSMTAEEKSGSIEKIEVYLDGTRENGGILLGEAKYGLPSVETAALYGEEFANSGYSLTWKNTTSVSYTHLRRRRCS